MPLLLSLVAKPLRELRNMRDQRSAKKLAAAKG